MKHFITEHRAWHTEEEKMYESVIPMYRDRELVNIILDWENGGYNFSEIELTQYDESFGDVVFPYKVMTYSGVPDRYGRNICEADYLIVPEWGKYRIFEVIYKSGTFQASEVGCECRISLANFMGEMRCEIIGNKYEDPVSGRYDEDMCIYCGQPFERK